MTELIELDRQAVELSVALVRSVPRELLGAPTPCREWTVGDLLAHMTAQHEGFSAAASGNVDDPSVWQVQPLPEDPFAAYQRAAHKVLAAFGQPGLFARQLWLPEVREGRSFPALIAVSFHLVDYIAHSWDVAAAIGFPLEIPAELVTVGLRIAEQLPAGPERTDAGSSFRPVLPPNPDDVPLSALLRLLGRDPNWSPAPSVASVRL
jgi:uncharacterized protein (TIGR03086 family)